MTVGKIIDVFQRLKELESELGVEIVSYGLAPNPNAYSYEVISEKYPRDDQRWAELELLCHIAPSGYLE